MSYEPATHTRTDRRVGRRPSGDAVRVAVHRYRGGPGPTVYVQAAQHGIELNGPATVRRLHERLVDAELAGTVVAVPVANPLAFDHRSYMAPAAYDVLNPNMNRIWPGDERGTFLERAVDRLWPLVDDADAVVDLHTGTPDMLEHVRFQADDGEARSLAAAFGTRVLLADPDSLDGDDADGGDGTDGGSSRGKFRSAVAAAGVPAITVELGNSRTVTPAAVETGVTGVENVLRTRGLLEANPEQAADPAVFYDDVAPVLASASGLFEVDPTVGVGDSVDAGEEIGAIYCPTSFERLQTVTAHESGLLYSLSRGAVSVAGERIAAVARPE